MEWLNRPEPGEPAVLAPLQKVAYRSSVRSSGVLVLDVGGEELEEAPAGSWPGYPNNRRYWQQSLFRGADDRKSLKVSTHLIIMSDNVLYVI